MPDISLTDFVDFVITAGTPKYTKVSEIKKRGAYHPSLDYWKPLRDAIVDFHRGKNARLDGFLTKVRAQNKLGNYQAGLKGYNRFLGRKKTAWFEPPAGLWNYEELNVRINPELGISINGKEHIIKLYFKSKQLTKNQIYVIFDLMQTVLSQDIPRDCKIAMLDVQRGKLLMPTRQTPQTEILLQGEAASFLQMWNSI